jgi:hypothetical protein
VISQEASSVLLSKRSGETPFIAIESTEIEELDLEEVPWLSPNHLYRATKIMYLRQIYILDIVA